VSEEAFPGFMINIIPFQIPDKGLSNTGNPFLKVG